MRTALIVEDNIRSMEMLVRITKDAAQDVTIKTAFNLDEAYAMTMKNEIDLFIVDIILDSQNPSDASGMRFADHIRMIDKYKHAPVIFVTALEDQQLYAYSDIHCYYYIEKPYDVEKARQIIAEALNIPKIRKTVHTVYFRKEGILYKKDISEVVFIEITRAKQIAHFTNGSLELPYRSCKATLQDLQSDRLLRCSRYVIVNKDFIDSIDTVNRYINLKNGFGQVEIGAAYKKEFMRELMAD